MRTSVAAAIAGVFAVAAAAPTFAATAFVNFDPTNTIDTNQAPIAQGPSIFVAVPAQQTISTNAATFSGGVVLGLATFFPAIAFASSPNVYGTADFGNNLAKSLTIDINSSFGAVNEVSFALFNGETFNQTYVVNAFNGSTNVGSQTLTSMAPNWQSGYGLVDIIAAAGITKVTIDAVGATTVWDFLIDDVAFNQKVTDVVDVNNPPPVDPNQGYVSPPEPPQAPIEVVVDNSTDVVDIDGNPVDLNDGGNQRRRRNRNGRDVIDGFINYGDDSNNVQSTVLLAPLEVLVDPAPVPEPGTWALMLSGLGMLGFMTRRRTRSVA